MAFCTSCGNEIGEAKFCNKCGVATTVAIYGDTNTSVEAPKKKRSRTKLIPFIAVGAIVLTATIIVGAIALGSYLPALQIEGTYRANITEFVPSQNQGSSKSFTWGEEANFTNTLTIIDDTRFRLYIGYSDTVREGYYYTQGQDITFQFSDNNEEMHGSTSVNVVAALKFERYMLIEEKNLTDNPNTQYDDTQNTEMQVYAKVDD